MFIVNRGEVSAKATRVAMKCCTIQNYSDSISAADET